jgi:hypothetical protein
MHSCPHCGGMCDCDEMENPPPDCDHQCDDNSSELEFDCARDSRGYCGKAGSEECDLGAPLLPVAPSASPASTEALPISVPVTTEELNWVLHAASLRRLTLVEYVRRAINLSLRKEGVDAVLLRQSDDDY